MGQEKRNELVRRTDRKLKFAELHLDEIMSHPKLGSGNDFEIAHEESFFFHIVGAKDSLLQEINHAYDLGLDPKDVKERAIQRKLKEKKLQSPELNEIIKLEKSEESWLAIAIKRRNEVTHRRQSSRNVNVDLQNHTIKHSYTHPSTRKPMEITIPEFLKLCLDKMKELLEELRATLPQTEC